MLRNYTGKDLNLLTTSGMYFLPATGLLKAEVNHVDKGQSFSLDNGGEIPMSDAVDGTFTNDSELQRHDDVVLDTKQDCEALFEKGHDGFIFYPLEKDENGQVIRLARFLREDQEFTDGTF